MNRQILSPRLTLPLFLFLSLAAISACARPPVKEMAGAGVAISAARAAGAEAHAPAGYRRARHLFDRSVRDVEASEYGQGRKHALEARKVALEAEEVAWRARRIEEKERREQSPMEGQPRIIPTARAILKLSSQSNENGRKHSALAARPALRHRVVLGESLWKISGYPRVYNDPFKWPLLYRANREQIADPDLIYSGQKLKIERDHNPQDVAGAIEVARTRGPWSLWDRK